MNLVWGLLAEGTIAIAKEDDACLTSSDCGHDQVRFTVFVEISHGQSSDIQP